MESASEQLPIPQLKASILYTPKISFVFQYLAQYKQSADLQF